MWQDHANCKDEPKEIFFPVNWPLSERALQLCAECPVRDECLAEAQKDIWTQGIWGGVYFGTRLAGNKVKRTAAPVPSGSKKCAHCGTEFYATNNRQIHCSKRCNKLRAMRNQNVRRRNERAALRANRAEC